MGKFSKFFYFPDIVKLKMSKNHLIMIFAIFPIGIYYFAIFLTS